MSSPSWQNPQRWSELLAGKDCPLCNFTPRPDAQVVAEMATCYAVADSTVNVRGYCCLILKWHAVELHQLSADEGAAFIADVRRAAAALQSVTGAIKLNYEVHGNVIPHIHLHLVPRYPGDAIEKEGYGFAKIAKSPYAPGEWEQLSEQIGAALRASA